ncbi:AAI domain-containing protein [Forsythia ovata]|uniref:AAI domain-containing protein n=1 Tax=Forsythia ovata TaxID=205694 RepID=A0ABD1PGG7_9LAMI
MASYKSFSLFFLVTTSWFFLGFSQNLIVDEESGGSDSMRCVQKLLPCQPYLKSSSSPPPPASCCAPLKDIIADDKKCLCAVFNNPAIMKTLNVTQDDALNLARTCGSKADASICKTASAPGASPTTPSAPSSSNSSASNITAGATKTIAASVISRFGTSLGVSAVLFLLTGITF